MRANGIRKQNARSETIGYGAEQLTDEKETYTTHTHAYEKQAKKKEKKNDMNVILR